MPFSEKWAYIDSLRSGGQGATLKVRRKADGVYGVLKIPHALNKVAKERFNREVEIITSRDWHPSIVKLLDHNLDESLGSLGYITPLGVPFDEYWSERSKKMPPSERYDQAYSILKPICLGLELLHKAGVIHRDIKPENIVMIDDEPVLIDFGLAIRPNDDRLSKIDDRLVANGFATPPAAHYGLHELIPAWDCLGLAWLYGYMLGSAIRPKQFHWRFHDLTTEARENRAKAILAICAHESTIPSTALKFLELLNQFRLGGGEATLKTTPNAFQEAEVSYAEARARRAIWKAKENELVEISIQTLEPILTELRTALNGLYADTGTLPIARDCYSPAHLTLGTAQSVMDILRKNYAEAKENSSGKIDTVFSCMCGSSERHFRVSLDICFSRQFPDGILKYIVFLRCIHSRSHDMSPKQIRFGVTKESGFQNIETGEIVTSEKLVALFQAWVASPEHWKHVG